MSRPLIVQGDSTDHGGIVLEGNPGSLIGGKPVATVGMAVQCPIHGRTQITTGQGLIVIDGKQAATHGDQTSCGATLISSQSLAGLA